MIVLARKYVFNADINHVFTCFTNIDYLYNECSWSLKNDERIKIRKSKDGFIVKKSKDLLKIIEIEKQSPFLLKAEISPIPKELHKFGTLIATSTFEENGSKTVVKSIIESHHKPGLLWGVLIKIIVSVIVFQSRKLEKEFITVIEKNA